MLIVTNCCLYIHKETVVLTNSRYVKCNIGKQLSTILCTSRTFVVYIDKNALSL